MNSFHSAETNGSHMSRTKPSSGRNRIFAVTWLAYAGFYFCRKNLSIVLPLLDGHGLSHLDLANIIFGYSFMYATGQFACGPLSDKFGSKKIVGIGLGVIVLSNLMMGLHGTAAWLLAFACLNGLGQSSGWSGLVKMMGNWFEGSRRGIVMAWWSTNYVLGGFLATTFTTWAVTQYIVAPSWGWRRGFVFPAGILLIVSIAFYFLAQDAPAAAISSAPESTVQSRQGIWHLADLLALFRNRSLWSLGSAYFFLELCRYALLFWLPYYLMHQMSFSLSRSGYLSSLYELAGIAGALLAGYISDHYMHSRRAPVSAVMLAGFGLVALLPAFVPHAGAVMVAAVISMAGLLTYGPDTLLAGAAAQDVGNQISTATTAGLIDGIGHVGSMVSPYLVIFVSERYGWNRLFLVFACASFLAAASLIPIWNLRPVDSEA